MQNDEKKPVRNRDLDLFKAMLILFCTNIIVLVWFWLSPSFSSIEITDQKTDDVYSYEAKMSPFTEVIDVNARPRPVRRAERLKPVLFNPEPPSDLYPVSYDASSLEAAQRTEPVRHVSTEWVQSVPARAVADQQ